MIVVTGATGTTGSELVRLLAEGNAPFRAVVRSHDKAAALEAQGISTVVADFDDPESLEAAMRGASRLFLLSSPDERQAELQCNAVTAAAKAGIEYGVKVSVLGVGPESPLKVGRDHAIVEAAATESGVPYTFLRPHSFMQNLLGFAPTIAQHGEFYASQGDGKIAMIDARDIAAVAAELLTDNRAPAPTYDLTGPEALSFGDAADILSEALERPVRYVDVSGEEAKRGMVTAGFPEWLVDDLITLYEIFKAGHGAGVSDAVVKVTGRQARSFRQFATDHVAAF